MQTNHKDHIHSLIEGLYPELVSWRRHLHQFPEVSFKEFKTTQWILEKLTLWGYEVHRPCETGCVAVLRGERPSERVVALRADIDALPLQEEGPSKESFLSKNEGVAHCCGHDLHTTNLLGTARLLADLKEQLTGTVVFIFQAAEESLPGGARLLMESGLLQKLGVQEIYGLHTDPTHPPGVIAFKEGPLMASPYEFTMEINGKGGHAAAPHKAIDPIVITAQVIQQLQTIVSRSMDPTDAVVVTVGKVHAGTAPNIIPEKALLEGTIRTFDEKLTHKIFQRITDIGSHTAQAYGGHAETILKHGYPPVINHPETTEKLLDAAGETAILMEKPIMAGEDFSFYLKEIPGTFFFLGSGSEEADSHYSWHHPRYNVDEDCLKTGIRILLKLVLKKYE
ncbi:M20 family metallopeptidase [Balneolaceae bacterium ANBcel3]|nr:M20 family metallopeptidase [Balneolaceae bacterium ANBcel3]